MKIKTKINPEVTELYDFINISLQKRGFLTVIAECGIICNGKTFNLKNRIIMVKPDKTLIIDEVINLEPLCSLPPKSKFQTKIEDNMLFFKGINENTTESIMVKIYKAHLASCHKA